MAPRVRIKTLEGGGFDVEKILFVFQESFSGENKLSTEKKILAGTFGSINRKLLRQRVAKRASQAL